MKAVAKILRARASEYPSNFCEQFEQRQNFVSTFKLNGTMRYPQQLKPELNKQVEHVSLSLHFHLTIVVHKQF